MADKKEKDLEPEKEVVREVYIQSRICHICDLLADDVVPMRIRATPPIDGVVDPAYEHDYDVPVCGECRAEINIECAAAEINAIRRIRADAAARRERAQNRTAVFLALEEQEEIAAQKKEQKEDLENVS